MNAFFLIFGLLLHSDIIPHGFAGNTLIGLESNQDFIRIEHISTRFFSGRKTEVATYKEKSEQWKTKLVQAVAYCDSEAYFELVFGCGGVGFSERIECSLLQLFYRLPDRAWVAAHELHEGDWLLCKNNKSVQLRSKKYVQQSIHLYIIEVKKHHTFVVGRQKILTHNMFIPITATIGMSIPFDIIFSAGSFGCMFGPVSFCCSVAVAGVAAAIVYQCGKEKHTDFSLRCDNLGHYEIEPKNYSIGCGSIVPDLGCCHKATVEDILKEAEPGESTKGKVKQYVKPGDYENAKKDFDRLKPAGIKKMHGKEGSVGMLPNGCTVIVREKSKEGRPTLEIQQPENKGKIIKIRYGKD